MPIRICRRHVIVASLACLVLAGCSVTSGLGPTQPSGTTQQLLIRALERGLNQLDLQRFTGRAVNVEVFVQAGNSGVVNSSYDSRGANSQGFVNQDFVKEFTVVWLKA